MGGEVGLTNHSNTVHEKSGWGGGGVTVAESV